MLLIMTIKSKAHGPYSLSEEDFNMFSILFYKLAIISPCRRASLFMWKKNLNFLYPTMIYGKFGWNWPCCSEVEHFKIFSIYFYYFAIIYIYGRVWAFICKNLNSMYPRMLCAKFGWNWSISFKERIFKEKIFKYFQYNFTILLLSPLWERCGPLFEQTWISST